MRGLDVFRYRERLFERAPCLSPWYFSTTRPALLRGGVRLEWEMVEKVADEYVGVLLLKGDDGACLGLVKDYTYVLPSMDKDVFLVWSRHGNRCGPLMLEISLYETSGLRRLEPWSGLALELRSDKVNTFRFDGDARASISVDVAGDGEFDVSFPPEFKAFDAFCTVGSIPGIYGKTGEHWNTTCIVVLSPKRDRIAVYPQDWFNKAPFDFDYQWITQAAINGRTGRIHGRGIRLNDFVLDRSNRNRRWW